MKHVKLFFLLLTISVSLILMESCSQESCAILNCNNGVFNNTSCKCDCSNGFSGTNCEVEDLCISQNVECLNGGSCTDGVCDCPIGLTGDFCENYDLTQVQVQDLLDSGKTPIELYDGNVPLDSLYGKLYDGGLIFYLNTSTGEGLIAATENQSNDVLWGCTFVDIDGLNNIDTNPMDPEIEVGARLGDGAMNTTLILEGCMSNDGVAAKLCRDLGDDWFMPSREELNLMYVNLYLNGYGSFAWEYYWSSTEVNGLNVWSQIFDFDSLGNGDQFVNPKENYNSVRAVRSF